MKKLLALTALSLTLLSSSAFAESFTGVVADAMCSKNAAKASSPDHAACAEKCIKGGEPAVLIVGSKVYAVANPAKLTAFAGKTVTVDGTVSSEGTLTVNSVK